jgi:tRNA threonylcarbamoyladenosine biosynthesis protein TsaE
MTSGASIEIASASPEETVALGKAIGGWLRDGDVLLLHGDLGAGKTTLAKGIAAGLGVESVVSSPSFALVNEYEAGTQAPVGRIYHLDLYRLQDEDELASIGYADFLAPEGAVTFVEWPERAAGHMPDRYVLVELERAGVDSRRLTLTSRPPGETWDARLADLRGRLRGVTA